MPPDASWRDPGTVLQVYQAARKILEYARGLDFEAFHADERTNNAVVLQLLVIGEATKRLSVTYRNSHRNIPWQQMAGMRDRLVHGYDQWDLERGWDVVTLDLPKLIDDLEPLVPKEE
jgi:uncharacterized protein with HEPN domain